MSSSKTLGQILSERGISRRAFLKYCAATASMMALSPAAGEAIAERLAQQRRPSVIWLSFQECTGCTESLTRSHALTIEGLILGVISLDYHHTLQAASGTAAELAREQAMEENHGEYLVVVDGSLPGPDANPGHSTIAGRSNYDILQETLEGAAAVVAVGSCAAFGGLPQAAPNPTGAVAVEDVVDGLPLINVPGCPPVPQVITGVLAQHLTFGTLPKVDAYNRPLAYYGQAIHDRCYRRSFYDRGQFARTFDDAGAKQGWCLYRLGCKGPTTYNFCAAGKWNAGTSWPVESGHPCLGCSEPRFWDAGGFYKALSTPTTNAGATLLAAGLVGAVAGGAAAALAKRSRSATVADRKPVTVDEMEQKL